MVRFDLFNHGATARAAVQLKPTQIDTLFDDAAEALNLLTTALFSRLVLVMNRTTSAEVHTPNHVAIIPAHILVLRDIQEIQHVAVSVVLIVGCIEGAVAVPRLVQPIAVGLRLHVPRPTANPTHITHLTHVSSAAVFTPFPFVP